MSGTINVRAVLNDTRRAIDQAMGEPDLWPWLADRKPTYLQTLHVMSGAQRELGDFECALFADDCYNRLSYWEGPDTGEFAMPGLTLEPLPPAIV